MLVLLVVAGSAFLGDLLIHRTGRVVSGRVLDRMRRRPRRAALLNWAAERIQRHGVPFVIGVRFLPSGRVVGGLAAGVVRYPARRYAIGAGVAEAVWAGYSVGAGYFSGRAASNSFFALTLGLGISILVATVGTVVQWMSRSADRRHPRGPGGVARPSTVVRTSLAGEGGRAASMRATAKPAPGERVVMSKGGPRIGPPSALVPPSPRSFVPLANEYDGAGEYEEADGGGEGDATGSSARSGRFPCGAAGQGK